MITNEKRILNVKSSWSTEHLRALSDVDNHRVRFDGYGFVWEHFINDEWELHSIWKYKKYNYYIHLIHLHTSAYQKELLARDKAESKAKVNELRKRGRVLRKVAEVSSYNQMNLKDKINIISELLPDENQEYIAEVLNVSRKTVNKYIKK